MNRSPSGSQLLILGDETPSHCRQHLARAAAGAGLEVAAMPAHGADLESPDGPIAKALRAPATAGVAVTGRDSDRCLYWAALALAADLPVLVDALPPGAAGPAATAVRLGASTGHLHCLSRAAFSPAGEALLGVAAGDDRVVAIELSVTIPRSWATSRGPGVLARPGLDYLGLLEPALGPLDSLWARSRSLLREGPNEDWALLAARCRDGTEAWLHLGALGEEAVVRLQLHGRCGTRIVDDALPADDGPELAAACGHFVSLLAQRDPPPRPWGHDCASALHLWAWAQQSARSDREIPRQQARPHAG